MPNVLCKTQYSNSSVVTRTPKQAAGPGLGVTNLFWAGLRAILVPKLINISIAFKISIFDVEEVFQCEAICKLAKKIIFFCGMASLYMLSLLMLSTSSL